MSKIDCSYNCPEMCTKSHGSPPYKGNQSFGFLNKVKRNEYLGEILAIFDNSFQAFINLEWYTGKS